MTIFEDNEYKREGKSVCIGVPTGTDFDSIRFILTSETSQGWISIDDIDLSTKECPRKCNLYQFRTVKDLY